MASIAAALVVLAWRTAKAVALNLVLLVVAVLLGWRSSTPDGARAAPMALVVFVCTAGIYITVAVRRSRDRKSSSISLKPLTVRSRTPHTA